MGQTQGQVSWLNPCSANLHEGEQSPVAKSTDKASLHEGKESFTVKESTQAQAKQAPAWHATCMYQGQHGHTCILMRRAHVHIPLTMPTHHTYTICPRLVRCSHSVPESSGSGILAVCVLCGAATAGHTLRAPQVWPPPVAL